MGQKTSDFSAIPLCADHHREAWDSYPRLGVPLFAQEHRLDLPQRVAALNHGHRRRNSVRAVQAGQRPRRPERSPGFTFDPVEPWDTDELNEQVCRDFEKRGELLCLFLADGTLAIQDLGNTAPRGKDWQQVLRCRPLVSIRYPSISRGGSGGSG